MRVVFDTNVVISGMLWSGIPAKALEIARSKRAIAFTSESLVDELRDVLKRSKFDRFLQRNNTTVEKLIADYLSYVTVIEPATVSQDAVRDVKDVKVLESGKGAQVQAIISGDDDLLSLKTFETISILTVNDFLSKMKIDNTTQ